MKKFRSAQIRSFLVDLAHPLPVSYFLLLHREGAQLLRVRGRRARIIFERTGPTSSLESLSEIWKALKVSSFYHGQPIGVLINNERMWFFHKRYDSSRLTLVASDLKSMVSGEVVTNHVIEQEKSALRVTAQGIEREYLDHIQSSASVDKVQVAFVTSLTAYLFANRQLGIESPGAIQVLEWSSAFRDLAITQGNGSCHFGAVPTSELATPEGPGNWAQALFFGGKPVPKVERLCLEPKPGQRGLAGQFKAGIAVPKKFRPLFKDSRVSKVVRAAQVVSNSLSLLIYIFVVTGAIAASVFVATRQSESNTTGNASTYQAIYSDNLELQRTVDSLKSLLPRHGDNKVLEGEPAAILSMFCQEKVPGIWLNSLTVRRTASDSVSIEAVGMARNSQAVFVLQKAVVDQPGSPPIALVSLHPEVVSMGSQTDTVQSFKLGASIVAGRLVNRSIAVGLIIQLAAACVLALAVNYFARATIESIRTSDLSSLANKDVGVLKGENRDLQREIDSLRLTITRVVGLHSPSLEDLKQITARYNLGIRRLERIASSTKAKSASVPRYSAWVSGTLPNCLAFLHEIDQMYLLDYEMITLQRANEDGSLISLGLNIGVREG